MFKKNNNDQECFLKSYNKLEGAPDQDTSMSDQMVRINMNDNQDNEEMGIDDRVVKNEKLRSKLDKKVYKPGERLRDKILKNIKKS